MRWGVPGAARRQVLHDAAPLWARLRERLRGPGLRGPERREAVAAYASSVRGVLAAAAAGGPEACPPDLTLEAAVWALAEAYLVAPRPAEGAVAGAFADWAAAHARALVGGGPAGGADAAAAGLAAALAGGRTLEEMGELPECWGALARLVARGGGGAGAGAAEGETLVVRALAALISRFRQGGSAADAVLAEPLLAALESLQVLLQSRPRLAGDGVPAATAPLCHNIADLVAQRERWREGCALLRDDAALWERCRAAGPTLAGGVQDCVAVLLGDGAALEAATDNWLEMTAAMLQHVYPTACTPVEMRQIADYCISRKGADDGPSQVVLSILTTDLEEAAARCSQLFSPWFVAHVADLLESAQLPSYGAADMLEGALPGGSPAGSLSERYCLDLAESLMPHYTTWPVAALYLSHCRVSGRAVLDKLLLSLPVCEDGWVADKALAAAAQFQRPRVEQRICRILGVHHWRLGQLGAAVAWLRRAGDREGLEILAQDLMGRLEDVLVGAAPEGDPEMERMEALMASLAGGGEGAADAGADLAGDGNDALSFLRQLRKLQLSLAAFSEARAPGDLAQARDRSKAALLSLLAPGVCPRRLWVPLMFHGVPLLEAEAPGAFSAQETEGLLQQLYEVVGEVHLTGREPDPTMVQAVQLAAMRHLSRCSLLEEPIR